MKTAQSLSSGLSANQLALIISTRGLTLEKAKEFLATSKLTDEEKEQLLTKLGLISATNGQTGENVGLTASLKDVTSALWAQAKAWIKTPLGMATAAIIGIYAIAKAVDYFTVSLDELEEKLSETQGELSEIQTELTSLENELTTISDKIAEINSQDNLSITDSKELEKLEKESAEIQRQIDLLKLKESVKQDEVYDTFVDTMNKDLNNNTEYSMFSDGSISKTGNSFIGGMMGATGGVNEQDYIDSQIKIYQQNLDKIAELNSQYANTFTKDNDLKGADFVLALNFPAKTDTKTVVAFELGFEKNSAFLKRSRHSSGESVSGSRTYSVNFAGFTSL